MIAPWKRTGLRDWQRAKRAPLRPQFSALADVGPEAFVQMIQAEDWEFVHDQRGVQTWAKLFNKVAPEHIFYFSPQTMMDDYPFLACVYPALLPTDARGCKTPEMVAHFVTAAIARACEGSEAATGRKPTIAYLADGPHGIPVEPTAPLGIGPKLYIRTDDPHNRRAGTKHTSGVHHKRGSKWRPVALKSASPCSSSASPTWKTRTELSTGSRTPRSEPQRVQSVRESST
jgi:hypothetical protein